VQVCIKEYQTLPFFDGIFATVFGQFFQHFSANSPLDLAAKNERLIHHFWTSLKIAFQEKKC
jgi:hypothetical protein